MPYAAEIFIRKRWVTAFRSTGLRPVLRNAVLRR